MENNENPLVRLSLLCSIIYSLHIILGTVIAACVTVAIIDNETWCRV